MSFNFASTASPAPAFGASPAPAAGGFGLAAPAPAGATGGFGGFGAAPAPATGGFGAASPAPAFGAAPASAFGAAPAPATGGFGAAPAPAAGGFGAAPVAAPAAGGFGGFGAAPAPAAATGGFGGFGTAPAPAPAAGGFGGFGAAPAPAPALGGFGSFGAAPAPATGGFGAAPAPAPVTGGFGGFGAAPAPAASGFGGFGGAPAPAVATTVPSAAAGFEGELRKLLDIRRQYAAVKQPGNDTAAGWETGERYGNSTSADPAQRVPWNDDCLFRFTVYLDRALAAQLGGTSDDLEPKAEENNPDPATLSPVTLKGIHALKAQFAEQNRVVELMSEKVSKIKQSHIESFHSKSEDMAIRIKQFQNKHNEQNGRLIKLLRDVEYLRSRNRPLEKREIEHRAAYDHLIARKNQCVSDLLQLEEINDVIARTSAHNAQEEFLEVSDEDLDRIYHLLKEQHEGIHHLAHILQKDMRDLEIMRRHAMESQQHGAGNGGGGGNTAIGYQ